MRKIQVFEGDIYLTFCSYGKGNEEYVLNLVKMIISFGAAALIIFDENIQALPPSAEKLCDETGLPVIFMDCQIPYSLIISSIIEYRLAADLKRPSKTSSTPLSAAGLPQRKSRSS